jgi:hypothetical protein
MTTNIPGETLTMTRGLLEDFKRHAAQAEREAIINKLKDLSSSRSQITLAGAIVLLQSDSV